tara:strand:+ start:261 stop:791 length:531 start_codon:yes stop_codon:yes gene_type:complete
MIKLIASSSNQFAIQPSGSITNGASYTLKFTDTFSKDEYIASATGSRAGYGKWLNLFVDVTGSYVIGTNTSQLPLHGGTYDLSVYNYSEDSPVWDTVNLNWELDESNWEEGVSVFSIYGTEPRKWKLMGDTWSNVPAIPTITGNSITTTKAWVSEAILNENYISSNENAAFVVYQG